LTDSPDNKAKPERGPKTRRVGQVLERGPNRWLVRIFIGYKPNGANDYFNKTIRGTKKDAEKWLRGALARQDRGEPLEDPDVLFEALYNEWFDSKKKKRKARTLEIYADNYKYYIGPTFGARESLR